MALSIGELVGYVSLDTSGVDQGAAETVSKVEGIGSKGRAAGLAVGGLIGLSIGSALASSLDVGAGQAKLEAQLGATPAQSQKYGAAAGSLFSSAYGENLGEVNDAIASVVRNVGGMADASSEDLERISGKVLNTASVFGQDLGEVTRSVGTLMRTGLAADADSALDLITAGLQSNANQAGDLLDTFNEYGTQFRKVGIEGPAALGLLSQGLQAGARDADVVADSIKEFSIRAIDGTELTADGFAMIGLNASEMATRVAAGGQSANSALDLTLDRLRAIPDPVLRSQAAVALFGTQAEDLGEALFALDPSSAAGMEGLEGIAGAADRVGDSVGGTAQAALTSFTRSVQSGVVGVLGDVAVPILQTAADIAGNVLGPAFDVLSAGAGAFADVIDAVPTPLLTALAAAGAFAAVRGPVTSAFTDIASGVSNMAETVALRWMYAREQSLLGAGGVAAAGGIARAGMAGFMGLLGGPVGLAIAGVTLGLSLLSDSTDDNAGSTEGAARAQSQLASALEASGGAIDANVRAAAAKEAQDRGILAAAEAAGVGLETVTDAILGQGNAYNEAITGLTAYRDANTGLDGERTEEAQKVAEAITALEGLNGETASSVTSAEQLAEATGETATQHDEAAQAAIDQKDALDELKTMFDELSGVARSLAQAQIDVQNGLQDMTDAVVDNGTSLDVTAQAGRDNLSAVLDQIGAIEDLATANYEQTGSMGEAYAAYQTNIGALRDHLIELGYNEAEVAALIEQYGSIPEAEFTEIVQPGMPEAQTAADILRDKVVSIPDDKTVRTEALTEEAMTQLRNLGLNVTQLPDGRVDVSAYTAEAQAQLDSFVSQRRTIYIQAALSAGGAANVQNAFRALGGAVGGIVTPYAEGGIEPMSGSIAQIVPPNRMRIIGDRVVNDEFFIPDDEAPRSLAIGTEWARRRGMDLVPARMAAGGIIAEDGSTVSSSFFDNVSPEYALWKATGLSPKDLAAITSKAGGGGSQKITGTLDLGNGLKAYVDGRIQASNSIDKLIARQSDVDNVMGRA